MERVLRTKIFKNEPAVVKPGAAVKVWSRKAQPTRRELYFLYGSFEYSSSRDVWQYIYRRNSGYLSSCILWLLAVPVAGDVHVRSHCLAFSDRK